MSEAQEKKVKIGVNFDAENYQWLKSHGNASGKLNEIIAAHRTGKIVATGEILQGEDGKGCIQPLGKEYKPEVCPFRIAYPQLQQAKNGLVLQESFCQKCPHYRKDFEAFKVALRKEVKEETQTTLQKDRPVIPLVPGSIRTTSAPFKCKNEGCGKTLAWTKENRRPVELETGKEHQCEYYQPRQQEPQQPQEKYEESRHVICSSCKERFGTFMTDPEALDRLLDIFSKHTSEKHSRMVLTDDETRQFRVLREAPTP